MDPQTGGSGFGSSELLVETAGLPGLFLTHGAMAARMMDGVRFSAAACRNKIVQDWHAGTPALLPG